MSLLQMSFYGTVMIIVIALIRMLAINKLPKRTFLVFWGIVLVRLILPFTVPSSFSIYSLVNTPNFQEIITNATIRPSEQLEPVPLPMDTNEQFTENPMPSANERVAVTDTSEQFVANPVLDSDTQFIANLENILPNIPMIIWMIGIMVLAVFFIATYVKCRREFQMSLPVDNEFVKNWKIAHKLKRTVDIRQSDRIKAPLTYGVFRPVILLPENTNWKDIDSLKHVLTHEYIHIRRFDAITKLLLTATFCLHWFNPLVWLMYILANKDIEFSCDESVIHTLGEKAKSAYANTLINMEESKSRLTPLYNNFSKNAIEGRITSIMKTKKTSLKTTLLSVLLVVSVTTIFVTASPARERYSQYIHESFTSDISKIDIDTVICGVFIETHDRNEIIVEATIENTSYEDPLTVKFSGDTLEISQIEDKNFNSRRHTYGTGTIVVKVPVDSKYNYYH